jgi:hypothetical protein
MQIAGAEHVIKYQLSMHHMYGELIGTFWVSEDSSVDKAD